MPAVLSNQLKAMLVLEDISEQDVNILQNNGFTVQHFSYELNRNRNPQGVPYGETGSSFLNFTVKVASKDSAKVFFERMFITETFPYSFLFNASFNGVHRLSDCEDAMVATGYVVDVEEIYESFAPGNQDARQMLVHVKLLVSKLAYLGQDKVLKVTVTND